ncbi:hypothetical protein HPP92_005513 [Vanilla planifolia]|uniref:Trichome birefringence-like N-terminal domain-containing protein n=1 Tax=Vanilla planifolia TaxID=51239 RepID=A0A835VCP3_VANPL|nr:hypothetical protein HPP92_005513 [Vanilla planifolia]
MAGEDEVSFPVPKSKARQLLSVFFVVALVTGFSFCLFYFNSLGSYVSRCPTYSNGASTEVRTEHEDLHGCASYIRLPGMPLDAKSKNLEQGKCDIFSGSWIGDPSGPVYTNNSCSFIHPHQNCMSNGRPDKEYLYWRWKPYGCNLSAFDSFKFLSSMRDKSWAFIGDSVIRNHIQSMLCHLSKVEEPVEIYHDEPYQCRTWYFVNHNFTLAMIWAPLLVKAENLQDAKLEIQLHLDMLEEKWTAQYCKYDFVIFSGGQWFLRKMVVWKDNAIVGCHNCEDSSIKELGIEYPYRKVLQLTYQFMTSSEHKPLVFFRTWTPDHFEYGEWYSGGICNRTRPYDEGQYTGKPVDHVMRLVELEEFEKAAAMAEEGGARLKLLDTLHLSLLRPDGHPGAYRTLDPFGEGKSTAKVQNDCVHWCLPGPIDTWDELIMKMLVDEGEISYS